MDVRPATVVLGVVALGLLLVIVTDRRRHARERAEFRAMIALTVQHVVSGPDPPPEPRRRHLKVAAVGTGMASVSWLRDYKKNSIALASAAILTLGLLTSSPPREQLPWAQPPSPPPVKPPSEDTAPDPVRPDPEPRAPDATDTPDAPPAAAAPNPVPKAAPRDEPAPEEPRPAPSRPPPEQPPPGDPEEPNCSVIHVDLRPYAEACLLPE